ncbi:MAG: 23S rRNA (adenine(2503)-C(2))-methyltransferase RlmN [Alphaproteobacteria bacterium]|nr:23S rRNA (adenine(2503)-C(2))-methyltransferase RlmN [Alphaproteobacteria bacterium]
MKQRPILFNMTLCELEQFVIALGQPRFRAKQIQEWLWRGAPDFSDMKNLPENLRLDLNAAARTLPVEILNEIESADGQTIKFLLKLDDSDTIETVLMRTSYGNSVCVSSQAGCAMGCKFCASTLLGLRRNLTANEMLAQILVAQWKLRQQNHTIKPNGDPNNNDVSHIVVMGTGEPLQNTENLKCFLEYANSRLCISWRRMTVSTCGIIPGIKELTEWGKPVNLAISLHAPNDELRSHLMPVNNKYKVAEILAAAFEYTEKTGRQLMIEYIMLAGVNDSPELAKELSDLFRGKNTMINLIPWNTVAERKFTAPSSNAVHRFQDVLIKEGIHVRIRRERGADIGSACGQLRLRSEKYTA